MVVCRSCGNSDESFFEVHSYQKLNFEKCLRCHYLQKIPIHLLGAAEEKRRYDFHENKPSSSYLGFLKQTAVVAQDYIQKNARGLDFGCGKVGRSGLSQIFLESGYLDLDVYDPFFYPEQNLYSESYDFVIANEVVEHFKNPSRDWPFMVSLIKKSGFLIVRTELHDFRNLDQWWYLRDQTHFGFYSEKTMQYLAEILGLKLIRCETPFVVFNLAPQIVASR